MNAEQVQRKLAAIFSADVAGYSRLMGDDEMATFNTLTAYREVMSNLIRQHWGRAVDMAGDNVLAEFASVVDAVQSAVAIQKELKARNMGLPEHRRMLFRIGINIGDVIQEGDRIYGDGVNIAARLQSLADPGGICISQMAYDQIETKLPLGYEYLGKQTLKNINRPLHAYRVIIEPENRAREETGSAGHERRKGHGDPGPEFRGDRFEQFLHRFRDHLKDFAKDIKEDEEIGESFQEIKGRMKSFAGDIADSKERRHEVFHNLIQSKHLRFFLGIALILFLTNAFTSYGRWWFQYPLVTIGLVIYLHWLRAAFFSAEKVEAMRRKLVDRELSRLDHGFRNGKEGKEQAEKQATARLHFYNHLYVFAGVNAFLITVNLFTSPFSWWFPFPLLGWGIGLFFHWMKLR
jgi:class 3 adenylate cyclase